MVIDGLIQYWGLVILLTFHEFGHAWMAWKCGDNTARLQGRVSLNRSPHRPDWNVVMPLLSSSVHERLRPKQVLIGWAKPVPVNPHNLRNPRVDDILVTLAGPWMNLLLAVVIMGLGRLGMIGQFRKHRYHLFDDGKNQLAALLLQSPADSPAGRLTGGAKF